ncbi:HAD-hyrolase-like-domain-containing protein [Gymnopilus junonius]|uniref:HAD-hyrolase-like-domain-containing protein n=1 Tax=Gymnopilus junonius TaxID=109634 RepID=A0A9P5NRT6_GYMJU|nr:HAD-hyrolase-like-domain-containing protein [Gymnopilus junonius]
MAFQSVFKALTGSEYPHTQFGKPTKATYDFAQVLLHGRVKELYGDVPLLQNVYMIGDNPESDVAGANAAGWSSILVKTGVYDPSDGPPSHSPAHIAEDVEEAVKWAIQREVGQSQLLHSK